MNRHVLHLPSAPAPEIHLTTYHQSDLPAFNFQHRFVDSYPEPVLEGQERIVTHRHVTIDGCSATIVRLEKTEFGNSSRGTQLLVDVANHTLVYDLSGFAASSSSGDLSQEMQAILSSFHVEKVAVLTGPHST